MRKPVRAKTGNNQYLVFTRAMALAKELGITPMYERIRVLEGIPEADLPSSSLSTTLSTPSRVSTTPALSWSASPMTSGGRASSAGRMTTIVEVESNAKDSDTEVYAPLPKRKRTLRERIKLTLEECLTPLDNPLDDQGDDLMDNTLDVKSDNKSNVVSDGETTISLRITDAENKLDEFFNRTMLVHFSSRTELYADCLPLCAASSVASPSRSVDVTCITVATPVRIATDNNECTHHSSYARCVRCKGKRRQIEQQYSTMWMLYSGALMHFTFTMNNFADFCHYKVHQPLYTADGITYMTGKGTVFLSLETGTTIKLNSVTFVPNLTHKLISMGALL